MTKEQLVAQGIIRSCEDEIDELKKVMPDVDYQLGDFSVITKDMRTKNGGFQSLFDDPLWKATSCIEQGNKVIKDYKNSIPAQPEKNWKVQATDEEYKFCLRDKGL